MKVTAKSKFAHGAAMFERGDTVDVSDATAKELVKAGLVLIREEKKDPEPENKMVKAPANKAKKDD